MGSQEVLTLITPLILCSLTSARVVIENIVTNASYVPAVVENVMENSIEDGPYGWSGHGGIPWSDGGEVHLNGDISSIFLRAGSHVESIRIKYGDVWGEQHGGGDKEATTFNINPGAKIIIVLGRYGDRINELEFITDDAYIMGPVGGEGGTSFVSTFPGCFLSYLSGGAGDRLDRLTFHWQCD